MNLLRAISDWAMNLEAGLLVDLITRSRTCSFCDFLVRVLAQNQQSDRPLVREDSSTLSLRRSRLSWSRGPVTDKNARSFHDSKYMWLITANCLKALIAATKDQSIKSSCYETRTDHYWQSPPGSSEDL
jgi:hypothetical protein